MDDLLVGGFGTRRRHLCHILGRLMLHHHPQIRLGSLAQGCHASVLRLIDGGLPARLLAVGVTAGSPQRAAISSCCLLLASLACMPPSGHPQHACHRAGCCGAYSDYHIAQSM